MPAGGAVTIAVHPGRLREDLAGKDIVELGCGTAYLSAWLARREARPVAVDLSSRQLASAARFQKEYGIRFSLVQADAEILPLPDEGFDLAISEYGASIWCDPYRWIPEAARVLPPSGELIFLVNGTIGCPVTCRHDVSRLHMSRGGG